MKQMIAICLFELKRLLKKPRSYLIMFALPLLFTFIFGGLIGGGDGTFSVPIALVDLDNSTVSKGLTDQLKKEKLIALQLASEAQAQQLYEKKKISGVITIPQGFESHLLAGEKTSAEFNHSPDLSAAAPIKQVVDNGVANTAILVKGAQDWSLMSKGQVDWKEAYGQLIAGSQSQENLVKSDKVVSGATVKKMSNVSERAAGFSIMFLMITLMMVTGVFLDARKNGVWSRILTTPSSRFSIVGGYLLSFFLIGWFQFGSLMVLTSLIFGVSWGDVWAEIVLVSALLLSTVGLGLAIAGFVRTSEQQAAIGNLVIVSSCMLGGVFWPLEVVPKFMQNIAEFVPQTWAMRGFAEVVARGGGIPEIWGPVAILLGFAVVFLGLGISRIRYE